LAENPEGKIALDKPAIDFTLEDVDDNEFSLRGTHAAVTVFAVAAFSESKGLREKYFKENKSWIDTIRQRYDSTLVLVGMGRLALPGVLKPLAKKRIREKHSVRYLIDWEGDVHGMYGHDSVPTVILVDKNKIVRSIVVGRYSEAAARNLFESINGLLHQ
jgi:hypothetical protein